jgi:hypothetical protein
MSVSMPVEAVVERKGLWKNRRNRAQEPLGTQGAGAEPSIGSGAVARQSEATGITVEA